MSSNLIVDIICIVGIMAQVGIIIYFLKKNKSAIKKKEKTTHDTTTYEGARAAALSVTPADLNLKIPENQTFVYGVVMDWDMGGNVLTLATYITGAANAYLSTGNSLVGGGKNPEVGEMAVRFVTDAQGFIHRTMPVSNTGYPDKGCTRFYLLTNSGIYAAQEQLKYIENTTSPWLTMFIRANTIVNDMKAGYN